MTSRVVPLGELCDMDRRGLRPGDPVAARLPLLGVEHVDSDTGALNLGTGSRIGDGKSMSFRFDERHVLYAKLRPYLNKVATPDFAGRCSTELVPLLPRRDVDREYLAHLLRRKETVAFVMSSVTGSRMPRADMNALMSMPVPLPPLDEQRRIVDILNRAARIETLRRLAAERLREFVPTLFVQMFGDPVLNTKGLPTVALGDLIKVSSGIGLAAKSMDPTGKYPVYGGNGINGYHSEYMFDAPQVVIGRVGVYCGAVHYTEPKSWVTDNALYIKDYRRPVDKTYLQWALSSANLNQYAGRAAQPLISGGRIYPVEIIYPDSGAQATFSSLVHRQERLLASFSMALQGAKDLFSALAQRTLCAGL